MKVFVDAIGFAAPGMEDWAAARKDALVHMDDLGAMLDAIRKTIGANPAISSKAAE